MSATLEKIKEEVRTLATDELQEVRALVDSLLSAPSKPQMTEEDFARHMAAKGVISPPDAASREAAEAAFDEYKPIEVEGQPLSEMIVEDRR
jgi:hypothetical protein